MGAFINKPLKTVLLTALLVIFLLFSISVLLPIFCLNLIYRALVWSAAKFLRPDLESFVTGEAAVFATQGGDKATINIMGTLFLKGDVRIQSLQENAQNIADFRDPETGERLYEKSKKTWEGFLGYAFWKTDRHFDVKNHVREYDYCGGKFELPNPCQEKSLARAAEGLLEEPWIRGRSRWEILLIQNVIGDDGEACSAAIFRIDHVLADGYSAIMMCQKFCQVDFELPKFKMSDRRFSSWEKAALCFKAPYDYLDSSLSFLGSKKLEWTGFQKDEPVMASLSSPVKVHRIKRIKNHYGVSYASVVYAGIIGAIEKAALASGQEPPPRIITTMILPKLGHPMKGMVVYATGIPVSFTLKAKSPIERLYSIQGEMVALSRSTGFLFLTFVMHFFAYFSMLVRGIMVDLFAGYQGISFGTSVFPAAASVKCHGDYELTKLTPGVGTMAPLGMIVSTGGVNNEQIFNFAVNNSVFKSQKAARNLGTYLVQEIQILEEAIGKT